MTIMALLNGLNPMATGVNINMNTNANSNKAVMKSMSYRPPLPPGFEKIFTQCDKVIYENFLLESWKTLCSS